MAKTYTSIITFLMCLLFVYRKQENFDRIRHAHVWYLHDNGDASMHAAVGQWLAHGTCHQTIFDRMGTW